MGWRKKPREQIESTYVALTNVDEVLPLQREEVLGNL